VNHFSGETAAFVFNDPRPVLLFFHDSIKGISCFVVAVSSFQNDFLNPLCCDIAA